ncbi:MAG: hypothetical protein LC130_23270 [Bryobacterales bacterium]|nr:hypothetical protein [Bryobacterales bacterium]
MRVKRPDILRMAGEKQLPDVITNMVMAGVMGAKPSLPDFTQPENMTILRDTLDVICRACFIEPHIVDDPQANDEIALTDVDLQDKIHVFGWAFGTEGEQAASFRPGQVGDLGVVPTGQPVPSDARPVVADQEYMDRVAAKPGRKGVRELGGERTRQDAQENGEAAALT